MEKRMKTSRFLGCFPTRFIIVSLFFLMAGFSVLGAQEKNLTPITSDDGKTILIPFKDLGYGATFYSYRTKNNVLVRFFALLDRDDKIHVAFDACDVCYQARKGYRVINGQTICNNCGQRYPLSSIGRDNIAGGCWPSYLPISAVNSDVVINTADIEKKQFLFP